MDYRIERDSMGDVQVPADKWWGAQTQRSFNNFKIGTFPIGTTKIGAQSGVQSAQIGGDVMPREIIAALSALVNIILNIILIPKFGLNAAAFTTCISELVGVLILIHFIDKRIKISGFAKMLQAPLIGSAVGIIAVLLIKKALSSGLVFSLIAILTFALLYILLLVLLKDSFFSSFACLLREKNTEK